MSEQRLQVAGGREIVLPMSKAVEISIRSLKIRFGRSLITTSGIILAIAFLMSVWSSNEIIGSLRAANKSDINLLLQKNRMQGVKITTLGKSDEPFGEHPGLLGFGLGGLDSLMSKEFGHEVS